MEPLPSPVTSQIFHPFSCAFFSDRFFSKKKVFFLEKKFFLRKKVFFPKKKKFVFSTQWTKSWRCLRSSWVQLCLWEFFSHSIRWNLRWCPSFPSRSVWRTIRWRPAPRRTVTSVTTSGRIRNEFSTAWTIYTVRHPEISCLSQVYCAFLYEAHGLLTPNVACMCMLRCDRNKSLLPLCNWGFFIFKSRWNDQGVD